MNRTLKAAAPALGVASLFFLHFFRLGDLPALHYDEAWALNYSWRIAFERGFWPLAAMSPYTAPWAHYWAALSMKIFGPSVLVFRASQVTLALAGMLALAFSLKKNFSRVRFLCILPLLPALVLNHRFAVELNGLHVLALGLFCLALSRKRYALAAAVAWAGTTAHILFYAVPLGLLAAIYLQGMALERRARLSALAYFLLTGIFFFRVLLEIPEKGKAAALVASGLVAAASLGARAERWRIWRSVWWERALLLGGMVFLFNGLFFVPGWWSLSIQSNIDPWNHAAGAIFAMALVAIHAFWAKENARELAKPILSWMLATTLFLGLMMLKPAPRYFEIFFLGLAVLYAGELRHKAKYLLLGALAINSLWVFSAYLRASPPAETARRFLFFKDSTRDFLDTPGLVRFLGGSGCTLGDIHTGDPRLFETLKALSRGNWPVDSSKPCAWNYVSRATDAGEVGEELGAFRLRRK